MNRRFSIGVLAAVGLLLPTLEGPAAARSVLASTAAIPGNIVVESEDCLAFNYDNGALVSGCHTVITLPLTVDNSGNKSVTFTARNPAPLPDEMFVPAVCGSYGMDRFGTAISDSPDYFLEVGQTIVSIRMDPVVVPSMGCWWRTAE